MSYWGSKSDIKREIPYGIAYNPEPKKKKIQMNLFTKYKQTWIWGNELVVVTGKGQGEGILGVGY